MAHKIIDNFLDHQDFLEIKYIFESENIPWYCSKIISSQEYNGDNFQLVHNMYSNHQFVNSGSKYTIKLINKIKPLGIFRIKANLRPKSNTIYDKDYFHVDKPKMVESKIQYSIGIFYLNTNNGFTILEDGTKIKSEENRMLFLSGDTKHYGTSATDSNRMVINFNFVNRETYSLYGTE